MNKTIKAIAVVCYTTLIGLFLVGFALMAFVTLSYPGEAGALGLLGYASVFVPLIVLASIASLVCAVFVVRDWRKSEAWLKTLTIVSSCIAAGLLLFIMPAAPYYLQ